MDKCDPAGKFHQHHGPLRVAPRLFADIKPQLRPPSLVVVGGAGQHSAACRHHSSDYRLRCGAARGAGAGQVSAPAEPLSSSVQSNNDFPSPSPSAVHPGSVCFVAAELRADIFAIVCSPRGRSDMTELCVRLGVRARRSAIESFLPGEGRRKDGRGARGLGGGLTTNVYIGPSLTHHSRSPYLHMSAPKAPPFACPFPITGVCVQQVNVFYRPIALNLQAE